MEFLLSLFVVGGVGVCWVCGRVCWLCGVWGMLQAWHWRDYLETHAPIEQLGTLGLPLSVRQRIFRAFVRECLEVWVAPLRQGFHPALMPRERAAIWGAQCCLLLVALGVWGPLIILGLEGQARRRWRGLPVRLASRWQHHLYARLTDVRSEEGLLKRVALASLYVTVEDVPEATTPPQPDMGN